MDKVIEHIDADKTTAFLRFSNDNAQLGATLLTSRGIEFVYIPQTPIADITTDVAWLYTAIAKFLIIEKYSVYDLISEIPVEGNESPKLVSTIKSLLGKIQTSVGDGEKVFFASVQNLSEYLGYSVRLDHVKKLYKTIADETFHVAFDTDNYKHIAITFHSSKGLEFEQVIVFIDFQICQAYIIIMLLLHEQKTN